MKILKDKREALFSLEIRKKNVPVWLSILIEENKIINKILKKKALSITYWMI